MNSRLFISTVRYDKVMDNGTNKTVNEQYLIDALSFTEAETRTIEELQPIISGEFTIPQIVKPRISELVTTFDAGAEKYYKVKVQMVMIDEKTATEKKSSVFLLVQAKNFQDALRRFTEHWKSTIVDYEIISIVETSIIDYFSYKAE